MKKTWDLSRFHWLSILLLVSSLGSAQGAQTLKRTAVFSEPSGDSAQLTLLPEGSNVPVQAKEVIQDGQSWLKVNVDGKSGYVRTSNVRLAAGDAGFTAPEPSAGDPGAKPWNPNWFIQTSPIGHLADRYNLQVGYFFGPRYALSVKGTSMRTAMQAVLGHDDGYEVGLRGTYHSNRREGKSQWGGHLGIFYADIRRGDHLGDAISHAFQITTFTRNEIKGPVFEALVGPLTHWNDWFITEMLIGLQAYRINYYNYDTRTGAKSRWRDAGWNVYPVMELNVGVAF